MTASERRYDIDWLRVIAIGLLLVYHIGIGFQPWGVFIGFIQNQDSLEALWIPMSMLNVWRIPLLFFVSGMGVCFAIRKRNWKQLIVERTRRILLPFLFGIFSIVPLHLFIWQKYYSQDLQYMLQAGHLWFLANIFLYVLIFLPFFFFLKKRADGKLASGIGKVLGHPLSWLAMAGLFVLETFLVKPESYELYAVTLHGFIMGAMAFLFGFLFVFAGTSFWARLRRWRWILLGLAVIMYLLRYLAYDLEAPDYLKAMETCAWVLAALALGHAYLNRPSKMLAYLSQAAYPVYIVHMIFLYLGSYLLMPLGLSPWLTFILVVLFTGLGCLLSYEFLIRRLGLLRPLFGLRFHS